MAEAETNGKVGIASTTAIALSTSSGGAVLIWIIRMFEDGHIEAPSAEIAMTLVAFLTPIFHAMVNALVAIINRFGGSNGNGAQSPPVLSK